MNRQDFVTVMVLSLILAIFFLMAIVIQAISPAPVEQQAFEDDMSASEVEMTEDESETCQGEWK